MKLVYIGSVVPSEAVATSGVQNVNISDNIAQNSVISSLYSKYAENLTVITVSRDKTQKNVKLDCGAVADVVHSSGVNRALYYVSIMVNYTKKLWSILREKQDGPVIVITSGVFIFVALPVFIARFKHKITWIPFLVGAIEIPQEKFPFSLVSKLSRITSKYTNGAITYVANSVIDYMPNRSYVEIPFIINEKTLGIYKNYQPKMNKKTTIVYTGSLIDVYNIETIVKVIRDTGDRYRWVFTGLGNRVPMIEELANDKQFDVAYKGLVDNSEAVRLQMDGDILLCLRGGESAIDSYYSRYAASGKLFEYMCSGTPVIVGDIPVINDTFKSYMTVIENVNQDSLKEAIEDILVNRSKKVSLAQSARKYAFKNFTADTSSQKIHNYIDAIIGENNDEN